MATAVGWGTAFRGAFRPGALVQSTAAAFVVGSILFMVNLYSHVRSGPFTADLAVRITLTFVVPWANATTGIAIGLRKSVER